MTSSRKRNATQAVRCPQHLALLELPPAPPLLRHGPEYARCRPLSDRPFGNGPKVREFSHGELPLFAGKDSHKNKSSFCPANWFAGKDKFVKKTKMKFVEDFRKNSVAQGKDTHRISPAVAKQRYSHGRLARG